MTEGYSSCLVCICLCLAVHAIKSIMKDTIMLSIKFVAILKWQFKKLSYSKVILLTLAERPSIVSLIPKLLHCTYDAMIMQFY